MKYFFSSPSGGLLMDLFEELEIKNFLLSYAVDGKHHDKFNGNIIIDSGAFTVWNRGNKTGVYDKISLQDYYEFIKDLEAPKYNCISLDVIPKTGGGKINIDKACEESYENYIALREKKSNIMPVFHYGDDFKWLKKYMEAAEYIGISPANDTSEFVKREWMKSVYRIIDHRWKTHALGYSSLGGMLMFPFYSIDSISYKRAQCYISGKKQGFLSPSKTFRFFLREGMRKFINIQNFVTEVWIQRGVHWDS